MTERSLLILGAGSDIARAIAKVFAAEGYSLQLAARDCDRLARDRDDLLVRHDRPITLHAFDVLDTAKHEAFIEALPNLPDVVVCAVGLLGDQAESESESDKAELVLRSNFEGPAAILSILANRFEARGSGTLVAISSVAGDRGRASNYVYGAAKAGLTAFLSGLRNRLFSKGVHVVTVKPGFVATRMTREKDLPPPLTATPEQVARDVLKAVEKKKDVVYSLGRWWLVMTIIRLLPEWFFKRTRI